MLNRKNKLENCNFQFTFRHIVILLTSSMLNMKNKLESCIFQFPILYRCPKGSAAMQPCPAGSYQPELQAGACEPCEAGSFCPLGATTTSACPPGYYCPRATRSALANACKPGTYSADSNLEQASECSPCEESFFCADHGAPAATGKCSAGYFCQNGAKHNQPAPGTKENGPCPVGKFCESRESAEECPEGTFGEVERAQSARQCSPCPPGFACPVRAEIAFCRRNR